MKTSIHTRVPVFMAFMILCLPVVVLAPNLATAETPAPSSTNPIKKGSTVTSRASGTFEVKINPLTPHHKDETAPLGRLSIDKQFQGELDATSTGEMLTAGTEVTGSAGYVAMERVAGKLRGRSGTFVLQHSGTMNRGSPTLGVTVVPDSGTGQLAGLDGKMTIKIEGGKHFYDFQYSLPELP